MELEKGLLELCKRKGGCSENLMKILGRMAGYETKTIRAKIKELEREGKIYCCRTERVFVKT